MDDGTLRRLSDIEEIKQLKARYFRYVDTKDWSAWRTVFADDAQLTIDGVTRTLDQWISVTRAWLGDAVSAHAGHLPEIEITGPDTATGIWAMSDHIAWPDTEPAQGMHGFGHYHEQYRRVDGRWLIHTLAVTRLRVDVLEGGVPGV
jgi:hypothetical protein